MVGCGIQILRVRAERSDEAQGSALLVPSVVLRKRLKCLSLAYFQRVALNSFQVGPSIQVLPRLHLVGLSGYWRVEPKSFSRCGSHPVFCHSLINHLRDRIIGVPLFAFNYAGVLVSGVSSKGQTRRSQAMKKCRVAGASMPNIFKHRRL